MSTFKNEYGVDEEKVLHDAIDTFGIEKQLIATIEELSELQKAIAEYLRYNKSDEYVGDILEELVDAEIMIRQVKKMFKMDEFYNTIQRVKIRNLQQFIEKERENGNAEKRKSY